jgi:LemA protein
MSRVLIGLGAFVVLVLLVVFGIGGTYNRLVTLDEGVQAQWAQVETAYQRRADLIPNLVATVKGAANFEKSTYVAVAEARSKVGQVSLGSTAPTDPAALAKFMAAQDGLSSALSHLLAVSESYPDLKASQNFADLQAQIEGSENRISVERMRFNDAAQAFNTARDSFPTVIVAGFFGTRFNEKVYFQSEAGASAAPSVKF